MQQAPASHLDLITTRMLEKYGERLSAAEVPTILCLDPLYGGSPPEREGWNSEEATTDEGLSRTEVMFFVTMLRTGSIFLLDPEEVEGAFGQPAPVMELPPLPFPRVVIEGHSWRAGQMPMFRGERHDLDYMEVESGSRSANYREEDGRVYVGMSDELAEDFPGEYLYMDMLVISELEPGQTWDVGMGYHFGGEDGARLFDTGEFLFSTDRVTPEGIAGKEKLRVDNPVFDKVSEFVRSIAVTAAHLIVADRVPRREVVLPRAQRKHLRRVARLEEQPQIYFVDIAAAGEEREPGVSDREYRHRWLVSGHWRLNAGGKTFVRHKGGVCSWVRPYVKGPPGAPWKGRPVHGRRETS